MSEESSHISPTTSSEVISSPKRSKRKRSEDLDDIISKKVSMSALTEQIDELTKKAAKQDELITEQNAVIKDLKCEVTNLKEEVTSLNYHIDDLERENEEQREQIDSLCTEIHQLEEETEAKLDSVRATVEEQAAEMRCNFIDLKQTIADFEKAMYRYLSSE